MAVTDRARRVLTLRWAISVRRAARELARRSRVPSRAAHRTSAGACAHRVWFSDQVSAADLASGGRISTSAPVAGGHPPSRSGRSARTVVVHPRCPLGQAKAAGGALVVLAV